MTIKIHNPHPNPAFNETSECPIVLSEKAFFVKFPNNKTKVKKSESDCVVDPETPMSNGEILNTQWTKKEILNWDEL